MTADTRGWACPVMTSQTFNISSNITCSFLAFVWGYNWKNVAGEFPSQRPVTWSLNVSFDLRLHKRLSKQSRRWWFEMPSRSLWRHRNGLLFLHNDRWYKHQYPTNHNYKMTPCHSNVFRIPDPLWGESIGDEMDKPKVSCKLSSLEFNMLQYRSTFTKK